MQENPSAGTVVLFLGTAAAAWWAFRRLRTKFQAAVDAQVLAAAKTPVVPQ